MDAPVGGGSRKKKRLMVSGGTKLIKVVPSCRSAGASLVLGIPLDRLDHLIKLAGAVDFPGHAAKTVGVDDLGFAEVVEGGAGYRGLAERKTTREAACLPLGE